MVNRLGVHNNSFMLYWILTECFNIVALCQTKLTLVNIYWRLNEYLDLELEVQIVAVIIFL